MKGTLTRRRLRFHLKRFIVRCFWDQIQELVRLHVFSWRPNTLCAHCLSVISADMPYCPVCGRRLATRTPGQDYTTEVMPAVSCAPDPHTEELHFSPEARLFYRLRGQAREPGWFCKPYWHLRGWR